MRAQQQNAGPTNYISIYDFDERAAIADNDISLITTESGEDSHHGQIGH